MRRRSGRGRARSATPDGGGDVGIRRGFFKQAEIVFALCAYTIGSLLPTRRALSCGCLCHTIGSLLHRNYGAKEHILVLFPPNSRSKLQPVGRLI